MRVVVRVALLSSMLAVAAFGQRFSAGFVGARGFGGFSHFGFRAGGFRGFVGSPFAFRTFPGHRFFGTRIFFGRPFFGGPFFGGRSFFGGSFFSPWSFPVFGGGYYGGGYGYPYDYAPAPSAPNVTVIYLPPSGGPETISERRVEQPVRPEIHEYGPKPGQAAAKPSQIYFWIARKDRSVDRAAAYWVEGGTLNYIDLTGQRKGVPLDQVDRTLSLNLNQANGVEFRLPGP